MITKCLTPLRAFIVLTLLCGVIYPLMVQFAALAFQTGSKGSLVVVNDKVIGSVLIGQANRDVRYFWPRPSATEPAYNAAASNSSHASIIAPEYKTTLAARVAELKKNNPDFEGDLPIDMVTASASGLDPDISPEAAHMQAERVAKARKISVKQIRTLIDANVSGKQWGFLGRERVNVLKLNLALDSLTASAQK
jgi:K+-transporting ATPase ATPase C chain